MPVKMILFAELPKLQVGKAAATEPKIAIRENGQIAFNSKFVADYVKPIDATHIIFRWNGDGDVGTFPCDILTIPCDAAKAEEERSKGGVVYPIPPPKKKETGIVMTGSALLQRIKYQYKASGNQNFDVNLLGKNKLPSLKLTAEKLTPAPKQTRERKKKDAPAAPPANAPAAPAVAATAPAADDDL
jgi:hypothetical protein